MADRIVLVDPNTNHVQHLDSVSFADLKVKERQNLENWVLQNPEVLGERLLVITSEFGRFDKSKRRLDILALDANGTLVIVELKLDTGNSLADLQAIRYAAFCSTMQMEDVVQELANYEEMPEDEADAKILAFLQADSLPELGDEPRIILAAGSINDQELTSCVLWLRRFEVNITCVELTPYKMPYGDSIMLVPRVIIPLPEARDYIIGVEKKEAKQRKEGATYPHQALWRAIADSFNDMGLPFRSTGKSKTNFCQIRFGDPHVHYEWLLLKKKHALAAALHFERLDVEENDRLLECIVQAKAEISGGLQWHLETRRFGQKGAAAELLVEYDDTIPPEDVAPVAAEAMRILIERTWPLIRDLVSANPEYMLYPPQE